MNTPLTASATTAGALFANATFKVPPYQREYSWLQDEVSDFWNDLRRALDSVNDTYFLGLVILTQEKEHKQVVDGQQRIITLTLLVAALYHEAIKGGRKALAERIQSGFLRSIDYDTDETNPRVTLSDALDNDTLQAILENGNITPKKKNEDDDSLSARMRAAYVWLREHLRNDLVSDPFKRMGSWTEFLVDRVYFAVFVHPDAGSAYRVFEVINTRGRELTTADLLKNYVLHQTAPKMRNDRYEQWKRISGHFSPNTFVQYIRHVVTVAGGHILPKDMYDYLAKRVDFGGARRPPAVDELMKLLDEYLPLYIQMVDPTLDGPADPEALKIFSALNSLAVISVRPILLAIVNVPGALEGMRYILQLVVRRIVVGNLGTGNVERKFGEAARKVHLEKNWEAAKDELQDLNPSKEEFVDQLRQRSYNKMVLTFLRQSVIAKSQTPDNFGILHFIRPRESAEWSNFSDEQAAYWVSTLGNTFLAQLERRPKGSGSWKGFKQLILPAAVSSEISEELGKLNEWNADSVANIGKELAEIAGNVWY